MALEGSLQDMSLTDLFQIFRTGSKSGVLILFSGPERGVVYVNQGRLVDAVLVRGTERQIIATSEDAVIQLLQWEEASFSFRHDVSVTDRPVRIVHDSEWLILEGIRRRENPLRMLPHQEITLDSRLEMAALPNGAESGVNLDLDQWRILSQIAISQNVREICERTGMEPEKAIRTATELVAIGLIEIAPPPRPAAVAAAQPRPSSVYSLPSLQPAFSVAGAAPGKPAEQAAQTAGRGLLGAIMRRIRGL